MSQAIIRGIWGHGKGHSDGLLEHTIRDSKQNGDPVDKVYCFGEQNRQLLQRCGYKPDMLDSEPCIAVTKPEKNDGFRMSHRGYGRSGWWHKTKILEVATQEFDHVLWQDFDVRLKKPLPRNFWEELKSKASFRAPLAVQRTALKGAWWRIPVDKRGKRRPKKQPPRTKISIAKQAQIIPAGGYLYIRGHAVAKKLLGLHSLYQDWNGQPVFALYIDQLYGEWLGIQSYINNGHEVEGYFYGGSVCRPKPEQAIWCCGPPKTYWFVRNTKHFWEAF